MITTILRTVPLRSVLTTPVTERDHAQGPSDAAVTVVQYGDYQCPHCWTAHAIMLDIQQHLGDRMRLVFRNFPLTQVHPDAQRAAEAAEAAGGQGKFWEMHDRLFEHQPDFSVPALLAHAVHVGLDLDRFKADLRSHAFAGRVRQDVLSGVRSNVNGTPTFFINGLRHDDPWDVETLTTAILAAGGAA